ncbi:MAG: hypothetical protein OEW12_00495 [Deltaproteobacteria bacterium]|nr:hypothetical protein [Deltaproteobacteria bacterium]
MVFLAGGDFSENPPPRITHEADRRLYVHLVRTTIRHLRLLDEIARLFSGRGHQELDRPVRALVLLGLAQLRFLDKVAAYAAVNETVEAAGFLRAGRAKGWLNGVLRKAERELKPGPFSPGREKPGDEGTGGEGKWWPQEASFSLAIRTSHPDWLIARWEKQFGREAAEGISLANNRYEGVTLRVETTRVTPENLARQLEGQAIHTEPHPLLEGALRSGQTLGLLASRPFQDGLFYVQDVSSQVLMGWVAGLLKGKVLDACAAPGGKLTLLAGRGAAGLELTGMDLHPGRLADIWVNQNRLGVPHTPLAAGDGARLPVSSGCLDGVLLDVPCSSTGMIRKYPELKWRKVEADLARYSLLQEKMVLEAGRVLKPGGVMVYMTCSLETEENQGVVNRFLTENKEFTRISFREVPPPPGLKADPAGLITGEGDFQMIPGQDRMGLYGALIKKNEV